MNIKEYVLQERARLLVAALTIVRGHLVATTPVRDFDSSRFNDWDTVIRGACIRATGDDPMADVERLRVDDATRSERFKLIGAWSQLCRAAQCPDGLTVEEALGKLTELETSGTEKPIQITFQSWGERGHFPSSRKLGYLLRTHQNVTTDQGVLRSEWDSSKNVKRWFVQKPTRQAAPPVARDAGP